VEFLGVFVLNCADVRRGAAVLGQAAGNPINCILKYFPEDL